MSSCRIVTPGDRPFGNRRGTRSAAMARRGMAATSQPLASAAALDILRSGGNAVDAAVAAAAVLAVVEPTMTGVGGDLFALVFEARSGRLHALNASGFTGRLASCERLTAAGHRAIPARGPLAVTVPGAVAGWIELLDRLGTLPIVRVLQPAIDYALNGFPVCEIVAGQWQAAAGDLAADTGDARAFLPGGRAPRAGEVFRNPDLGATLETIADHGRDGFYRGPLAGRICRHLADRGGLVDEEDFAAFAPEWVAPLRTTFHGAEVFELPPNTQGFVVLEMLNVLESDDLRALGHNSAEYLHLLVEAKRIAFADRAAWLADPRHVPGAVVDTLVSKEYARRRRAAIGRSRTPGEVPALALPSAPGFRGPRDVPSGAGDTVYLTVADGEGNVVSLIQSLFESFGSAVVPPGTGIALHNRGSLFVLDPRHPNALGPRKRPLHTLIPAMVFRKGRPWLSFGVMGGDLQPQGHVQVLANLLAFGMDAQEAGEAARVRHGADGIALESGIDDRARAGLEQRGHTIVEAPGVFGGYQGIMIDHDAGVLIGGSDPRKDGCAIGF